MRNAELWYPTKFVRNGQGLVASGDAKEVGVRSRLIANRLAAAYWPLIRTHAKGTLADIGCGKVPLYEAYRDIVSEVICVDWQQSQHRNPHLDIEADLNLGLPLPDGQADTILATDVLEHLRDPKLFWSESARVLRPCGKIILGVPFLYWVHEQPHDFYRYTEFALRAFCAENALSVAVLEPYAGPVAVVLDIVGKNLPGHRAAEWYQALANWLLEKRMCRAIDADGARLFPLGYCLVAQKSAE